MGVMGLARGRRLCGNDIAIRMWSPKVYRNGTVVRGLLQMPLKEGCGPPSSIADVQILLWADCQV